MIFRMALLLALLAVSQLVYSSDNRSTFKLYGLSTYTELGKEIFLGGVYIPRAEFQAQHQDSAIIEHINRIEYRIVADSFSKRRLLTHIWQWAFYANKDFASTEASDQLAILDVKIKTALYRGDRLVVQKMPGGSTQVSLNTHVILETRTDQLFEYIFKSWLGPVVPNRLFKSKLLEGVQYTSNSTAERYHHLHTNPDRLREVESWNPPNAKLAANEKRVTVAKASPAVNSGATKTARVTAENKRTPATRKQSISTVKSDLKPTMKTAGLEPVIAKNLGHSVSATSAPIAAAPAPIKKTIINTAMIETSATAGDKQLSRPNIDDKQPNTNELNTVSLPNDTDTDTDFNPKLQLTPEVERLWKDYNTQIARNLYRNIKYPRKAYRRRIEGKLVMNIVLDNKGELIQIEFIKKSGSKLLDRAAVIAIQTSGPWPAPPQNLSQLYDNEENHYDIQVPITFKLTKS
ncbi:MAG: energy transducer TonB [Pseudomonadales bacterium]